MRPAATLNPPLTAHPPVATGRVGALLVNLGTPEAPTAPSVRRYLAEFLSDRRVVDYPRALWLPLLHGVILNIRPARSARAYAKIWSEGGSPLRRHTKAAADALGARWAGRGTAIGDRVIIDWAMRYGAPSIADQMARLKDRGCERILILPMYPQYSQATSASVADAAFAALGAMIWQPAIRIAAPFHDHPAYVDALKETASAHLASLDFAPERVIISFHGTPKRHLTKGDPYHCHCAKTARLLRAAMGWTEDFAPLAFQSKFGREEWLSPATDATIRALADQGIKKLAVITPGFMADCLETLEEIAIVGRESFVAAGGERFTAIACLNASEPAIRLLTILTEQEIAGWI